MSEPVCAKRTIIQVIPASGWYAVYDPMPGDGPHKYAVTLAAWALMEEEDGYRYIAGLSANLEGETFDVERATNFRGYLHENNTSRNDKARFNEPIDLSKL